MSTSSTSRGCMAPTGGKPSVRGLLEQLGLEQWGDKLPTQFSRGMRQKASLAMGFIRPFSLLLADEPFDGLDPPSRDVLVELLRTRLPPAPR